jgi:hypothetical protein
MNIRLIGITEQGSRAYINYDDGFGDWVALVHIEAGHNERLVRLHTPEEAPTTLDPMTITSVAQLLLGKVVTLGEPLLFVSPKFKGYVISSYPVFE